MGTVTVLSFFTHFLIILLLSGKSVARNITTDRDTLLALKAQITEDPSNFLAKNWNSAVSSRSSVCNWTGVTCDVHGRRVTALNISGLGLTGTIPSQIGNLSSLQTLDLSFNNISGTVPSSIFSINSLQELDLSNNQLSGSLFPPSTIFNTSSNLLIFGLSNNKLSDQLPPNICNRFPKLVALFMEGNMFHGEIPSSFSICKQLQKLLLSFNNFTGAIPIEICTLANLEGLILNNNQLQGTIPSGIGNLSSLEILDLSNNLIAGTIPTSIFTITSLSILDLSFNPFSAGFFPSITSNMSSLKVLGLYSSNRTGELPQNICNNLPSLEILALGRNKFHGKIPSSLSNCMHLEKLVLPSNKFSGAIPKEIGNMTKLVALALQNNKLQGEIPNEIGNLHNLEYLAIAYNELVGGVPVSIFNISTLREFGAEDNSLSGILPSSANVQLSNLEDLYLWGNNFSGPIPNFIFNASKLSILALAGNSFSGFIPNAFGSLRNLMLLELHRNHFKSPTLELRFLSSLKSCTNLKLITLSNNPLNGILPRSIGHDLPLSIEKISMKGCNIGGTIPENISNLTNLTSLFLGDNYLNGSIPITLGRLQKLQGLNLEHNELEGSIPESLCGLSSLSELHMSGNRLSGPIPECFGNLTSLRKLVLSLNELTSIPSSLWNLKEVLYFIISSNVLSGPLPSELGKLEAVLEIDLSRNNLLGEIPATIGGLKNVQALSLGNNRLQGSIPTSLGDLVSLESLDLSNNNLSGIIPPSMKKLSYLRHLNLSFNGLEGEIPTGGSFENFTSKSFVGNKLLCGSSNLQVPTCKSSRKSKKNALLLKVVLPLSLAVVMLVMLPLIFLLISRFQKKTAKLPNDNMSPQATRRRFSRLELLRATDGFSENNLIGKGSFGSVYKATLEDEMDIAVKVFHPQSEAAMKSFDVECEVLKNIRHRNLVKIISSCSNEDFKALVLEFMPNGSMEEGLHLRRNILDIFQRLNIMIDVASALEYLHFEYSDLIIHCDIKPCNILLDDNMVAHLSDFGIAKLLTGEHTTMAVTQTLATIGYMAPEHGGAGQVSTKGDVYSYGITLMEAFTKKRPTDEMFVGDRTLRGWVNDLLPTSVMELVDPSLLSVEDDHFSAKKQCAESVLHLGLDCTHESADERINAKEIVSALLKIRAMLLKSVATGRGVGRSNLR